MTRIDADTIGPVSKPSPNADGRGLDEPTPPGGSTPAQTHPNFRKHLRNLVANWTSQGANIVVMFFLSPFVVGMLGKEVNGVWSLLNVLIGYMAVLDLGVRASTGRYVILYIGRNDHPLVDQTIRTGMGFFTAGGLLLVATTLGISIGFPGLFKSVNPQYRDVVRILLPVLAINVWLTTVGAVLSSVLVAYDQFHIARSVDIVGLAVRTVGTVLALVWGYGLIGLTAVLVISNLAVAAGLYAFAHRTYPRLRLWPPMLSRPRLGELMRYGIGACIIATTVKLGSQTDLVVVGAAINVPTVTIYSVGAMVVWYSGTFIQSIETIFFPSLQRAAARNEIGTVGDLFLNISRSGLSLGLPLYLGFIIFGKAFLSLWMGGKLSPSDIGGAYTVMAILSCAKLVSLFDIVGSGTITALGHIRFTTMVCVAEALLNLGLSLVFVLVLDWGIAGVALGTVIANIISRSLVNPFYACRRLSLSPLLFVKRVVVPAVLAVACIAAWYKASSLLATDTWWHFARTVALAAAGAGVISCLVLLPEGPRRRIAGKLAGPYVWVRNKAGKSGSG